MRRALLVIGLGVGVGACVQPITRPMRTAPGGRVTLAAGGAVGGQDEVFCYEGCAPQEVSGVAMTGDAGHGWMLAPGLGVSAGVRLGVAKTKSVGALGVAWGQVTVQRERVALAVGTDLGANVIGPLVGIEVRPFGGAAGALALTAYLHYAHALRGPVDPTAEDVRERSSWDTGVSVRAWRWFVQYAYDRRVEGRFAVPSLEGAGEARTWHVLIVGRDLTFTIGG